MVNSVPTPGCTNPDDLNTTAIINTGANQTQPKAVIQPKGPILTTRNLILLLNKLPANAKLAYRTPGIKHNLIAASELINAGCKLFFHQHGCEVTLHQEIILRGWRGTNTKLWRISLLPDGGQNVIPQATHIKDMFKVPTALQAHSLYKCSNTSELINFYYATMGYHITSTWCKAINRGYFQGWPGLTSDRVRGSLSRRKPENKATWTSSEPASAQQNHHTTAPTTP
eukprot:CCRYP_002057-RB/>CCRYP_002057-RB protein AED:0.42 eAED:0.42 QI:0/0/0/1/0/0/2/0/226